MISTASLLKLVSQLLPETKTDFLFKTIAVVESPFEDKFGIPRQPQLASSAKGIIRFHSDPDLKTALKTIEEFSHLWIIFVFHAHGGNKWKPSIRPPRLGGNVKVGVLASRSPHRPNPIGMSAVKIERVDLDAPHGPEIHVSGLDLLNGTPVLDIKPYITYADSIPHAHSGWAENNIQKHPVIFSELAQSQIDLDSQPEALKKLIQEMIEIDPRPAHQKRNLAPSSAQTWGKSFGINILNYDVKYKIQESGFLILELIPHL